VKFQYRPRINTGPIGFWPGSLDRHGNPLAPPQLVSSDDSRATRVFEPRQIFEVDDDPVAAEFFGSHDHFRTVREGTLR
jgi:hypothetical protein